ncbi:MAG: radical SAM protein [Sorangiineae bacterium]|nr:radical SAM protein [Polyangiaceae bacterium]MEB2323630.1 radical SAM protein [Sorangiineae bacterium]
MTTRSAPRGAPPTAALESASDDEIGRAYHTVLELGAGLALGRRAESLAVFAGGDRVSLDLEGRLHRAWLDGDSYQRGLDGRVRKVRIGRDTERAKWLEIELLAAGEIRPVLTRVTALVRRAAEAAASALGVPDAIAEPLARAAAWDLERYARERARFERVYRPIPILPPDQNRAVVVQFTEGCSYNRCAFCHLYKDVRFRLRSPEELARHVREVRELFGSTLQLRRGVFLGQANALVVEQRKLLEALGIVRAEFGSSREWPIGAFIDSFTKPKTVAELRELVALGLEGVSLGLESGSAAVLTGLGKPVEVDAAVELIHAVGEAELRRGIIVLIGAGGRRLAGEHTEATVRAIERMRLGPRDRVYLSPLHVHEGSRYEARMAEDGLDALTPNELAEQAARVRAELRARGVKCPIALYDIRRFIY